MNPLYSIFIDGYGQVDALADDNYTELRGPLIGIIRFNIEDARLISNKYRNRKNTIKRTILDLIKGAYTGDIYHEIKKPAEITLYNPQKISIYRCKAKDSNVQYALCTITQDKYIIGKVLEYFGTYPIKKEYWYSIKNRLIEATVKAYKGNYGNNSVIDENDVIWWKQYE